MNRPIKTLVFVLGASAGVPTIAAEQRERSDRTDQGLIHESAPIPSGIYNLRRSRSKLPNSKNSLHRKPRVKSELESMASRD